MPRKMNQTKVGKVKSGKLSIAEIATIKSNAHSLTAEQIASQLKRSVEQIKRELGKIKGIEPDKSLSLKEQLETRPEWFRFQKQFSYDEQQEFKHQYVQIMSQLTAAGDIYATEELQVFQVITLKIQIDRTLEAQKQAIDDINEATQQLSALRNAKLLITRDSDEQEFNSIIEQMAYWSSVYESGKKTNAESAQQYKTYSDKQDKMLNTLKATRDQRIKVWENSDKSILGLVRLLVQEEQRKQKGEESEMARISSEREKRKLSKPYKFADGTVDRPILTPETVFYDDEGKDDVPTATEEVFKNTELTGEDSTA